VRNNGLPNIGLPNFGLPKFGLPKFGLLGTPRQLTLICLTTIFGLIPIFIVDKIPSQDGPAHIYVAQMLRLYGDAALPLIERYFDLNWRGQPNLFVYIVTQPLLAAFSPAMAEKILAATYVILIPCATLSLAIGAQKSAVLTHLALWPLLYGFMFFFGFYNYCFGLLFALLGIACWLWMRRKTGLWPVATLGALASAGYVIHLFPLGAMMLFIGVGALIDFVTQIRHKRRNPDLSFAACVQQKIAFVLVRPAIAMAPALCLVLIFLAGRSGSETMYLTDKGQVGYGLAERFSHITMLSFNLTFGPLDALISIAIILIGAYAFLARERNSTVAENASGSAPLFAGLLLVFLIVFAIIPGTISGHTFVLDRLLPFVYLCFVIWLIHTNLSGRQRRIFVTGLGIIGLLLPAYRALQMKALDKMLQPFHAVSQQLEPNRTLLAIRGASFDDVSVFWKPFYRVNAPLHASASLAASRHLIDLKIVQTSTKIVPLTYRDEINPYWHLPANMDHYPAIASIPIFENFRMEAALPVLDFGGYKTRAHGDVDYLLIWGPVAKYEDTDAGRLYLKQIAEFFHPVPLREGRDHLKLFRRKTPSSQGAQ
jgi:hypothetical protein